MEEEQEKSRIYIVYGGGKEIARLRAKAINKKKEKKV